MYVFFEGIAHPEVARRGQRGRAGGAGGAARQHEVACVLDTHTTHDSINLLHVTEHTHKSNH